MEPTITVTNTLGNGTMEITKAEFTKRWTDHATEFARLIEWDNEQEFEWYGKLKNEVETLAGKRFDEILKEQTVK